MITCQLTPRDMFEILCGVWRVRTLCGNTVFWAGRMLMGWGSATAPVVCAQTAAGTHPVAERAKLSQTESNLNISSQI